MQVCVPTILEKFKEKKSNVVAALRDCMDAMYPCLTLENIQEDLLEALNNKNPSIKAETCLFLGKTLTNSVVLCVTLIFSLNYFSSCIYKNIANSFQ